MLLQEISLIISNPVPSEEEATGQTDNNTETENPPPPAPMMSFEDLQNLAADVVNEMQTGNMSSAIGVVVLSMSVVQPPLPPDSPEWQEQTTSQYADVKVLLIETYSNV